jgi:HAD superfamily hydrolase (TIGR01458 family)
MSVSRPLGVLLDLDGTIWDDDERPYRGSAAAIAALRAAGLPLRFVTNTTRMTRAALAGKLAAAGIPANADDIFTATLAAVIWLGENDYRRIAICLPPGTYSEFAAFEIDEERPEAVVVGDMGVGWTFEVMNRAFHWLLDGAEFLALHRNRFWKTGGRLVLDAGAFVAALEYATGRRARLVGKPSPTLFISAAHALDLEPGELAMVGDSLLADIEGAQSAGCLGVLVRTGKFDASELASSPVQPNLVVDSVADLPAAWLD